MSDPKSITWGGHEVNDGRMPVEACRVVCDVGRLEYFVVQSDCVVAVSCTPKVCRGCRELHCVWVNRDGRTFCQACDALRVEGRLIELDLAEARPDRTP
jgi:hypothetical protein